MPHEELTEKIVGCACRVYDRMGYGFPESIYEACLLVELRKARLHAESQKSIAIRYEDEVVGDLMADIVVERAIILELKTVREIGAVQEIQLVNHLVVTDKPVGLVLNFGERRVDVKRKFRVFDQQ